MKRKSNDMLKRAGICAGTVVFSAALLTGCDWFQPKDNIPETVYGPPEVFETPYRPADDEPEDVYGPPPDETYNPEDDEMAPVYGPPPDDWASDTGDG